MSDDMILDLERIIAEPKHIARKVLQVDAAHLEAELVNRNDGMVSTLRSIALCFATETSDLYFDWINFAETCQIIFDQLFIFLGHEELMFIERDQNKERFPFIAVHDILNEALRCQLFAEDIGRGADVLEFVGENAKGMNKSWEIIQEHTRKDIRVIFEGKDGNFEGGLETWIGDKEILGVISKGIGEKYPTMSANLQAKVYKNWPKEHLDRSAVLRVNFLKAKKPCFCCHHG